MSLIPMSTFHIADFNDQFVFLHDLDGPRSITNDAQAITSFCHLFFPGCRVIYRDTQGEWAELVHTQGKFTGYLHYQGAVPK